jgi:transposase-like protein
MHYHLNAKTNIAQRLKIKKSDLACSNLASKYEVSIPTIAKWKKRSNPKDKSHRPDIIHYAVDKSYWRLIAIVRKKALFSLDDLVLSLSPYVQNLKRDNCFRILKKYRLNCLSSKEKIERKKFAFYKPGYLHIDVFYLPKLNENGMKKRYYTFLAIDRTTRMIFLEIYEHKDHIAATDFLVKCLRFFPFKIHHVMTDNGKEFTQKNAKNRWGDIQTNSLLDFICKETGIKHKLTKPKHPWTNGMAERAVRTVKDHTVKIQRYLSITEMYQGIKHFEEHHNFYRNQKVLKNKTPFDVMVAWFVKEPKIFFKDPTVMLKNR